MKHYNSIRFILLALTLSMMFGCQKGKSILIKKTAEEVNKTCPREVDYITTLESCEFVPENTIKYNYTLSSDISDEEMEAYNKDAKENVIYQSYLSMNQPVAKTLKALSPTLLHTYRDKSGKLLYEIEVTPDMYKTAPNATILGDDEMYESLQQSATFLKPKNKPTELGDGVFLTNVEAVYPRILAYSIMMIGTDATDIDTTNFKNRMKPTMSQEIKADRSDQILKDNNTTFRYIYFDKEQNYICTLDITPNDYQ